ncbi:hypothetical protein BJY14_004388 [Actinomadura luteofluorescens]|uniref:Uncharacterized protein n=1 Tax=Actinomadura luteofluorescens TaxID=46163 RepID=A0A7Y9EIG6_9ACTN|nr:hypothetical protein [Actinomadura luteofluorescens]
MALLPATAQRPRPPVWIAGFWPNRRPMRRAARWDGAVPLFGPGSHGRAPDVEDVRDLAAYVRRHPSCAASNRARRRSDVTVPSGFP